MFTISFRAFCVVAAAALANPEQDTCEVTPRGLLQCLDDKSCRRSAQQDVILHDCIDRLQQQCTPEKLQLVSPWPHGFGAAMNFWVTSFLAVLADGHAWQPIGPWNYSSAGCGSLDCYFESMVPAGCNESSLTVRNAASYRGRRHLVKKVAESLEVSSPWVWGQLLWRMMKMRPHVQTLVEVMSSTLVPASQVAGIQLRTLRQRQMPSWDGRHVVLAKLDPVDHMMASLDAMLVRVGGDVPKMIHVMSDAPNMTGAQLNLSYPKYHFSKIGLSAELMVDLGHFHTAEGKVIDGNPKKLAGVDAAKISAADVTHALLAEIWSMVRADLFLGTSSNLFWLIFALREARSKGVSCIIELCIRGALQCPGDPLFDAFDPCGPPWTGPR